MIILKQNANNTRVVRSSSNRPFLSILFSGVKHFRTKEEFLLLSLAAKSRAKQEDLRHCRYDANIMKQRYRYHANTLRDLFVAKFRGTKFGLRPTRSEISGCRDREKGNGIKKALSEDNDIKMSKKKKMDLEELKQEVAMDEHKISLQELCSRLNTNMERGLSVEQARKILERDGPNALTPPKRPPSGSSSASSFSGASPCFCGSVLCCVSSRIPYRPLPWKKRRMTIYIWVLY
ncbi:hypothetical protein CEXT_82981 [Caerostris extrusa]|uniref:Cation-transporting P-type ATPase N-terminal domain-containing protein n=1 Tax=Caerostris extrusa TaxID=172846 RepID=A0AAV4UGW9_CAEEX|nr:hypothetical protein CEXT_82981 [Caerostris extrusa]